MNIFMASTAEWKQLWVSSCNEVCETCRASFFIQLCNFRRPLWLSLYFFSHFCVDLGVCLGVCLEVCVDHHLHLRPSLDLVAEATINLHKNSPKASPHSITEAPPSDFTDRYQVPFFFLFLNMLMDFYFFIYFLSHFGLIWSKLYI